VPTSGRAALAEAKQNPSTFPACITGLREVADAGAELIQLHLLIFSFLF